MRNRKYIPAWIPNCVGIVMLLGILALLWSALHRGSGSLTSSYEKLADVTTDAFGVHIERFRSRPGGFYFAIPVPDMERSLGSTQSFAGVVKVSSRKKPVAQYEFVTTLSRSDRLHLKPNDGGKFAMLFLVQFDGARTPKEFQSGKSYDFEFQLSSLPETNVLLVQKYWHTPGR